MALACQDHPSVLVDTSAFLIHEETLLRLHEFGLAVLVVKVAHQVVCIEVMSLNAEWCWNLTARVQLVLTKHLLEILILNHTTSLRVNQVTTRVDKVSIFILILSFFHNNVSFVVS